MRKVPLFSFSPTSLIPKPSIKFEIYIGFFFFGYTPLTFATPTQSDHFDDKVEDSLRRDLPIITTPHAKAHLTGKGEGEAFTAVHDLDFFEDLLVDVERDDEGKGKEGPKIKVTGMPGKHVGDGVLGTVNDLVGAVSFFWGCGWEGKGVDLGGAVC